MLSHVLVETMSFKRKLDDNRATTSSELDDIRSEMRMGFKRVATALNRIATAPVVRQVNCSDESLPVQPVLIASLSPAPSDLYTLWNEYQNGVGGYKPAKLFTDKEKGKVVNKYCFRKNFWVLVEKVMQRDSVSTTDAIIDRIYAFFGRGLSVTKIIRAIKAKRKELNGMDNLARQI